MGTHIVLFLEKNTNIDFQMLVKQMEENYKEMGKGIIIEKSNNTSEHNFIFSNQKEIIIDGNNHHISINLYKDYETIKEDIIEMLWDAFDYCDLNFTRIGYIKEIEKESEFINTLKNKMFKDSNLLSCDELQLSYHNLINYKKIKLNCWKRYIKFYDTNLIINYDINTIEKETKDINYKFVKEFLNFSDNYIKEDIDKILEG